MKKAPDLPRKVKFGPYTFQIKEMDAPGKDRDEEGRAANEGYADLSACMVLVKKSLPPYNKALVLHHELGHVIRYVFGGTEVEDDEKAEEHNVNVYSTGYIMMEQDNPALMEYFDYYLRNKR